MQVIPCKQIRPESVTCRWVCAIILDSDHRWSKPESRSLLFIHKTHFEQIGPGSEKGNFVVSSFFNLCICVEVCGLLYAIAHEKDQSHCHSQLSSLPTMSLFAVYHCTGRLADSQASWEAPLSASCFHKGILEFQRYSTTSGIMWCLGIQSQILTVVLQAL